MTGKTRERRKPYETRRTLAYRRVINNAAVYAEPYGLDVDVFRAATEIKL